MKPVTQMMSRLSQKLPKKIDEGIKLLDDYNNALESLAKEERYENRVLIM